MPNRLTANIAFVSFVIAFSILVTSILSVSKSTSTKLGVNPFCINGKYVVDHDTAGTITSPSNLS